MVVVLDGLLAVPQFRLGAAAAEVGARIVRIESDGEVVVGNGFLVPAQLFRVDARAGLAGRVSQGPGGGPGASDRGSPAGDADSGPAATR